MKKEKRFDAVQMMRDIRDKLSREVASMSYEEQRRYIDERLRTGEHPGRHRQSARAREGRTP